MLNVSTVDREIKTVGMTFWGWWENDDFARPSMESLKKKKRKGTTMCNPVAVKSHRSVWSSHSNGGDDDDGCAESWQFLCLSQTASLCSSSFSSCFLFVCFFILPSCASSGICLYPCRHELAQERCAEPNESQRGEAVVVWRQSKEHELHFYISIFHWFRSAMQGRFISSKQPYFPEDWLCLKLGSEETLVGVLA